MLSLDACFKAYSLILSHDACLGLKIQRHKTYQKMLLPPSSLLVLPWSTKLKLYALKKLISEVFSILPLEPI